MDFHDFLGKLNKVKRSGKQYQAQCPAHDDHEASLFLSEGEDGRILIKCFAGCTAENIVGALGLTLKDLFASSKGGGGAFNPSSLFKAAVLVY